MPGNTVNFVCENRVWSALEVGACRGHMVLVQESPFFSSARRASRPAPLAKTQNLQRSRIGLAGAVLPQRGAKYGRRVFQRGEQRH